MSQKPNLIKQLYAEINNFIAPTDTSLNALPPSKFVCLKLPGEIVSDIYKTTSTKAESKKAVYLNMNKLLEFDPVCTASKMSVPNLFSVILTVKPPEDNKEEAEKLEADYNKAQAKMDPIKIEYKKYRDLYDAAIGDYWTEMNKKSKSDLKIKQLKSKITRALEDWNDDGYKGAYEAAQAIKSRYEALTPTKIWGSAKDNFEKINEELGLGEGIYPVTFYPSNWADDNGIPNESWMNVNLTSTSETATMHHIVSERFSTSSSETKVWVFFKKGHTTHVSEVTDKFNESSSSEELKFSFKIARVEINRDEWFNGTLLTFNSPSTVDYSKGDICPGSLEKARQRIQKGETLKFPPFIPTAIIVAKDIEISGKFSEEQIEIFNGIRKSGGTEGMSVGPFYAKEENISVSDKVETDERGRKVRTVEIRVGKGMQIIGYVNSVLTPEFPHA